MAHSSFVRKYPLVWCPSKVVTSAGGEESLSIGKDIHRLHGRGGDGSGFAMDLVARVAKQWEAGLPIRVARKVLRKRGIHACSLLVPLVGESWARMGLELNTPRWILDANVAAGGPAESWPTKGFCGFAFFLPKSGQRLPNGLATPCLRIEGGPHLHWLPSRLWCDRLEIWDAPSLKRLSLGPALPASVRLSRCARLNRIRTTGRPLLTHLELEDCALMQKLPRFKTFLGTTRKLRSFESV